MRFVLIWAMLLALAPAAALAQPIPQLPKGASYPEARGRLIGMGIEPVPVKKRRTEDVEPCPYATLFCQTYTEVLVCGVGNWMQYCQFLFRRRADGQLLIVQTAGQANDTVFPADFNGITVQRVFKAEPHHLRDVVIASDGRKDRP